ncbi:hypothetical protein [Nonomuraea sp. NPDC005650]|uniref:hypothetical protein n=1 Tax=Nonomuraea sp. NPDC005650 TaxID=3157045 RepID=UPI0033A12D23
MSRVLVQLVFAFCMLSGAVGLIGGVWRMSRRPRITPGGDPVSRGRGPRVLAAVIVVVFVAELAAVWASWPTT